MLSPAPILEVQGLDAWYGKSQVLRGVDLHVGRGEIVAILGRNGAGRSTTLKAIMGGVVRTGRVVFAGEDIGRLRPHAIARRGLGYVPEDRAIFPDLTTLQNLLLGEKKGPGGAYTLDDAYALFPRLKERANAPAGALSGGEQQMLAICRTLMGSPALVMVDEPTEGLAPHDGGPGARAAGGGGGARHHDPAGGAEAGDRAGHLAPAVCDGARPGGVRGHARRPGRGRRRAPRMVGGLTDMGNINAVVDLQHDGDVAVDRHGQPAGQRARPSCCARG